MEYYLFTMIKLKKIYIYIKLLPTLQLTSQYLKKIEIIFQLKNLASSLISLKLATIVKTLRFQEQEDWNLLSTILLLCKYVRKYQIRHFIIVMDLLVVVQQ